MHGLHSRVPILPNNIICAIDASAYVQLAKENDGGVIRFWPTTSAQVLQNHGSCPAMLMGRSAL
eukprot:1792899-Amphidinium_carterae.1